MEFQNMHLHKEIEENGEREREWEKVPLEKWWGEEERSV